MDEKTWANSKQFFAEEHQNWQETQPSLDIGVYHLANFAKQKEDKTVNVIALLADATSSDQKIYANLANNVAPLATKLALANKIIVAALRDNARL